MSETTDPAPPYNLFRDGNYLRFLACRFGSMTGFTMLAVAVGWDVYSRTGNVFNLALIGLSMFIPGLLLFLLAGIAADRYLGFKFQVQRLI